MSNDYTSQLAFHENQAVLLYRLFSEYGDITEGLEQLILSQCSQDVAMQGYMIAEHPFQNCYKAHVTLNFLVGNKTPLEVFNFVEAFKTDFHTSMQQHDIRFHLCNAHELSDFMGGSRAFNSSRSALC